MYQIKITEYPNYYVDNLGNVFRLWKYRSGEYKLKRMKPNKAKDGYLKVGLSVDNKLVAKLVSRLIADAFIPNPFSLPTVD